MLIPKNVKKEAIENPMRPKIGIPREKTRVKLSWADFEVEPELFEQRVRVDADHIDAFLEEFEALVPASDRYRCDNKELWLVDKKWKIKVVDLAKKHFDEVITELRKWD